MSDDYSVIAELARLSAQGHQHVLRHYLYFPAETGAAAVAATLRGLGFRTEQRLGADGVNWLVLARHEVVPTEALVRAIRQLMVVLVVPHGGEYDGWEAEMTGWET